MKIDVPNSMQGQQKLFDNRNAQVTSANSNSSKQIAEQVASAIYHKDDPVLPETYGNFQIQQVYKVEDPDVMVDRYKRLMELSTHGIAEPSVDLESGYLSAMSQLPSELQEKDWSFSVRNGKLEVKQGSDELADGELSQITQVLQDADVEYAAKSVANAVIEMIETERGPSGLSKGIGRYDVNISNFDDIVDLRRYVQEHLPGAKYGGGTANPSAVESRYFSGGYAMMDQIAAKADTTYHGSQFVPVNMPENI